RRGAGHAPLQRHRGGDAPPRSHPAHAPEAGRALEDRAERPRRVSMAGAFAGIDLGTTNTVVARGSVDGNGTSAQAEIVHMPQLVTPTEIEARPLSPSCLYAPLPGEIAADPWGDAPWATGELARRRGGEVPGRAVFSS